MNLERVGPKIVPIPEPANGEQKKCTGARWAYKVEAVVQSDIDPVSNVFGADGWELIAVLPCPIQLRPLDTSMVPGAMMIFKRPK